MKQLRGSGRSTLTIASLAVLATFLDTTALFVAFGDIAASFPTATPAQLSWVLNAYTITFGALLIPAGKLADRAGHRRAFLAGSAVFTLASLTCALAPSVGWLIAFRVIQALGAAVLVPSSFALVLRGVEPARVPIAVAVWGAMGALAGALGPTVAALLIESVGWRWVFLVNLPIGAVTVALGRTHLVESRDLSARIPNAAGVVLTVATAGLLSLAIVQSDAWGWTSARTLLTLAAAGLVGAALVAHQLATSRPVVDPELFTIRNFRWANIATLAFGTAFAAMFFGSVLFLTEVWGWSVVRTGLAVSPGPLLVLVAAPRCGRLAARVGQRPLLVTGGLVFAAGGTWRLVALDETPDYLVAFLPSMLLTGLGVALCLPQLASTVGQALPADRLGVGGATNQAARQLAGTVGVALTIATIGRPTDPGAAVDAFAGVWWLLVVGGLATSAACIPLRTSQTATTTVVGRRAPAIGGVR